MRALLQRVSRAEVRVDDETVGAIGRGLVVFLGVGPADDDAAADGLARTVAELRIFADEQGRTNRSVLDVGGDALVVSQFTLFADTRRGRRPGFSGAAPPDLAERLYLRFADALGALGVGVATGRSRSGSTPPSADPRILLRARDMKNRPPCGASSRIAAPARGRQVQRELLVSVRRQRVQTSALVRLPFCSMTSGCRFGL